ncbi:hypothetical protein SLEP1_g33683 [Rubroshorea leprosula]|uniref:Uncharacterized protein n=1 Tax=Rubroshorea leprosula TaxID=152421 RepID=A0AAV5KHD4_9ROSI|nr:hypothetical protein SLEP1_g33683 [Rubroshorea leprosula]
MRVSDSLASTGTASGLTSILLLKSLQLGGFLSIPEGSFSNLSLLILSASFTFIILSVAFLIDMVAILQFLQGKP